MTALLYCSNFVLIHDMIDIPGSVTDSDVVSEHDELSLYVVPMMLSSIVDPLFAIPRW